MSVVGSRAIEHVQTTKHAALQANEWFIDEVESSISSAPLLVANVHAVVTLRRYGDGHTYDMGTIRLYEEALCDNLRYVVT